MCPGRLWERTAAFFGAGFLPRVHTWRRAQDAPGFNQPGHVLISEVEEITGVSIWQEEPAEAEAEACGSRYTTTSRLSCSG
jgi:hypothetical protein